ncbi:MAG: PilT/PilU family type 4a pilus ATPase [Gammaproteobacteria bacterium]|nr:PilT/PilU family type 4a pilus ATPase [Gammaproteobacteria bacterium]
MAKENASDLFFSCGAPVNIKIEGITAPLGDSILPSGMVRTLAYSMINEEQRKSFEETLELNFGTSVKDTGRFRVNLYQQRGEVAMVIRYIKTQIPSIEELQLPLILKDLVSEPRGLILIVGATGSGKSTTLASMIEHRNSTKTGHILTIEEPIEFLHSHKKSIVDQREVGVDTLSYANALKNAMREAPDVILIGEIRDKETMQHAIAYAETGHLCLSTLHANNANQTLSRIINFFPQSAHHQLLSDLSLNLRAVISQRLIPGIGGKRVPAIEVMLKSAYISDLIEKGDVGGIKEAIEKSTETGMQSFDQCLFTLFKNGKIGEEEALNNADSRNNLALKFRLSKGSKYEEASSDMSINDEST